MSEPDYTSELAYLADGCAPLHKAEVEYINVDRKSKHFGERKTMMSTFMCLQPSETSEVAPVCGGAIYRFGGDGTWCASCGPIQISKSRLNKQSWSAIISGWVQRKAHHGWLCNWTETEQAEAEAQWQSDMDRCEL